MSATDSPDFRKKWPVCHDGSTTREFRIVVVRKQFACLNGRLKFDAYRISFEVNGAFHC